MGREEQVSDAKCTRPFLSCEGAGTQTSPSFLWVGGGWLARLMNERVGGNSLSVAFIDSESVAIATLWRLSTPTVGVNSLGLLVTLTPLYIALLQAFVIDACARGPHAFRRSVTRLGPGL